MADNGNQGNGSQGQEPGTGTQGQGQEPASQQGQQQGNQGQEPGAQDGQGQADISTMSEADLRVYAAKVQKDAEEARREAAKHRTTATSAQAKVQEYERNQMSEAQKAQADLEAATAKAQELETQVRDLRVGSVVRDALSQAGALNPATAQKVLDSAAVKLDANGNPTEDSVKAAIQALKTSDPYLFKRTATADAGAGQHNGSPEGGSSINDMIRGRASR